MCEEGRGRVGQPRLAPGVWSVWVPPVGLSGGKDTRFGVCPGGGQRWTMATTDDDDDGDCCDGVLVMASFGGINLGAISSQLEGPPGGKNSQ